MTKRRDFIKKSVLGLTAGIATGGRSLNGFYFNNTQIFSNIS